MCFSRSGHVTTNATNSARNRKNAIRDIRNTTDKAQAEQNAPKVFAMIDKLAKIGVIHKNKAANLKSGIAVYINKLA